MLLKLFQIYYGHYEIFQKMHQMVNLDCDLFVGQFNFENVSFPAIVTLTILCLAFKVSEVIIKFS